MSVALGAPMSAHRTRHDSEHEHTTVNDIRKDDLVVDVTLNDEVPVYVAAVIESTCAPPAPA
jgi:hypothetical protein